MLATSLSRAARSYAVRGLTGILLFALSLALMPATAEAVTNVLVNDTWKDGNDTDPFVTTTSPYAENTGVVGNDADADGDIESAWFQGGAGELNPVAANGPLRGTVTAAGSSSWTSYFTQEDTPVQLNLAGDSIKVTWSFRLTTINATNASQNLHIGLVDAPSGSRRTDPGTPPDGAFRGYGLWLNVGQTLGHGAPFELRRRNVSTGNLLSSSGNWNVNLANGATNGNDGYDEATDYTLTWQITRRADNGLDIDAKIVGGTLDNDGTAQVTFTDATPVGDDPIIGPFGSYTYDTFALRPSNSTTTAEVFDTTLFKVEFTTSAVAPGVPGDYNGNGKVDGADYVVWRNGGPLQNEVDAPGTVNDADYAAWRARFGNTSGAGAGVSAAGVPEPGTIVLLLASVLGMSLGRRRA